MQREKIKAYLDIAAKAGYLIVGSDKLDGYNKKLYLVLIDASAAKSSQKVYEKLFGRGIDGAKLENLGELLTKPTCKIVGVKNHGLSEEIKKYLN